MDIAKVKEFMGIYPWIEKCMFQTYDDAKKGRPLHRDWSYLTVDSLDMLKSLNEQGASICFSVNGSDTQDRHKEGISQINAWITEMDNMSKEDQMGIIRLSPIEPSLIIESKNWYHLYWFSKEWTIENWHKICRWLRNFFEWDPNVITIERILRIPWFDHCKDEDNRFEVTMFWWCLESYTEMEMLLAFSNIETYQERKDKQAKAEAYMRKYEIDNSDDNFRKRVWDIPSDTMLEILSWTKHLNWEVITFKRNSDSQKQILVDWKSTGCRIDSVGKIWTGKGAWWWPTRKQRVARYGRFDWPELYRLIVDKFPAFKPKEKENTEKKTLLKADSGVVERKDIEIVKWFVYGSEVFDKLWCAKAWELVTVVAMSNTWKTTIAMDMLRYNAKKGKKWLYINCEFDIKNVPIARRLFHNWKQKSNITDIDPLSPFELQLLNKYCKDFLAQFDYLNFPWGITREDLEILLRQKEKEWYELVVIDSFSKIDWNLFWNEWSRLENQNKAMLMLQAVCLETWLCIVNLHHTNKSGVFEGSWHILNISEVMILMNREEDELTETVITEFVLSKDKFQTKVNLKTTYNNWIYTEYSDNSDQWHTNYKKQKEEEDEKRNG